MRFRLRLEQEELSCVFTGSNSAVVVNRPHPLIDFFFDGTDIATDGFAFGMAFETIESSHLPKRTMAAFTAVGFV